MMSAQTRTHEPELLRLIKERIEWDKRLSLADLEIEIRSGIVAVSGFLDCAYKKAAALEIIAETEGVWSVEDRIVVLSSYIRADEEIQKILEQQIEAMIKVQGEHIEIEVMDGIVKLTGEVFRPRLKAMADAAAWELSGVRDCFNLIEIKQPPHRAAMNDVLENVGGLHHPHES